MTAYTITTTHILLIAAVVVVLLWVFFQHGIGHAEDRILGTIPGTAKAYLRGSEFYWTLDNRTYLSLLYGRTSWLSADDHLPPAGEPVLAFYVDYRGKPKIVRAIFADLSIMPEIGWYESTEADSGCTSISSKVTHWMWIPQDPISMERR